MRTLVLSLAFWASSATATVDEIKREILSDHLIEAISGNRTAALKEVAKTVSETDLNNIKVDVLWQQIEGELPFSQQNMALYLDDLDTSLLSIKHHLMLWASLSKSGYLTDLEKIYHAQIRSMLKEEVDHKSALFLLSNKQQFVEKFSKEEVESFLKRHSNSSDLFNQVEDEFRPKPREELQDLLNLELSEGQKSDGYKFQLFMLCRHNRKYKCLFVLKDKDGQFVRNSDGSLWTQSALGASRKDRPYHKVKGYTPSGVYHLHGVMPKANKKIVYGKFRRVIIDFIRASENEIKTTALLPASAHDKVWWKEAVIARDVGRSALRIHGTGLSSSDWATYYPHVQTSGCISQIEGEYDDVRYIDQRHILDRLMEAMGNEANSRNERKIKGMLYLIEMNDERSSVRRDEIIDLLP